jgi:hypothetical protein
MPVIRSPNFIEAKTIESEESKKGHCVARDIQKMRTQGTEKMSVSVKGLTRSQLISVFYDLSYGWFAVGNGRPQAAEIDVHPSLDVRVGDPIRLQLETHHLWQYGATAEHRGYNGFGRIIGRQIKLDTGVQTLTVLLDGVLKSMALSPSAKVLALVSGSGGVSEISVSNVYHSVFSLFLDGESSFKVLAYLPGQDGTSYGFNVNGVTLDGDHCKLSVASTIGSFTLSAGWYITNAVSSDSNESQAYYAHIDSLGFWI